MSRFLRDRRGATGIIFGLSLLPICLAVGAAIDFSRQYQARSHLQSVLDAALLAAASSDAENQNGLRRVSEDYLDGNAGDSVLYDLKDYRFDDTEDSITASLEGAVPATFLRLIGWESLPVRAEAKALRGVDGTVEVALVLDNTWSMSEADGTGSTKLAALKAAAKTLVNEIKRDATADVKIALVPYADYVNVGTQNRSQPWVSVPADYTTAKTCETKTTRQQCTTTYGEKKYCTRTVDGVPETYDCTPSTSQCQTVTVPAYQSCSGGATYRWYGCVGSRSEGNEGNLRLTDNSPSTPYPGYLSTSQNCLTPIIPLTTSKTTVLTAIDGMIINVGSYKPLTYIPAGLVWGLNALSATQPFAEGTTYDPKNRKPRKVIVLMTDGENTLKYRKSDGRHVAFGSTTAAKDRADTDKDSETICRNAKVKKIEIFTVALAVDDAAAKAMLQACATDDAHYFDATDTVALNAAFAAIARSLRDIRLAF